jgi:GH35 family endo-1,4-beta-xylanase
MAMPHRICILVLIAAALRAQSLLGGSETSGPARIETVAVSTGVPGAGFTEAWRIETPEPGRSRSDSQAWWSSAAPVEANARLRVSFWVRKIAPEDRFNIRATLRLEDAGGAALLDTVFPVNTTIWTFYAFDLIAAKDYAPGALILRLLHGEGPQTYEIGGLAWTRQAPPTPPSAQGERVAIVGDWPRGSSYFDGTSGGGSARLVPVEGQSFREAMRITTNGPSAEIFRAALSWVLDRSFTRNDVMHASFWVRRVSGLEPIQAQAILERNGGNYSKSLSIRLPLEGDQWQRIQIPFQMDDNYTPGGAAFRFQFGGGPQVFEIADVVLLHYGTRAQLSQLPIQVLQASRNPNSPWRKTALEGIEKHRKAGLTVKVTGPDGAPVPGASVTIQQLSHAFRYGSAVTAGGIMGNTADDLQYRSRLESHFNTTVLENDLKWPFWEANNSFPQARTRAAIAWLEQRQIPVRGHVLVWGGWRNLPADLPNLSPEALRARLDGRIRSALTDPGLAGKLYHWDVQNEPYDNFDIQGRIPGVAGVPASNGVLGNDAAVEWFSLAKQLAPDVKLYLNDYDQFESGSTNGTHLEYTFAYLKRLRDRNAAVDGFGFQGHFGNPISLEAASTVVERYAREFPYEFAITEFDVNTADEIAQAYFTEDFMTFVFGHPRFTDFLLWGFWERRHWLPRGAMYRADWSSKPNAVASNNLLFRDWWTNVSAESGADGATGARVFLGSHQVTVRSGENLKTVLVEVRSETEVVVQLP